MAAKHQANQARNHRWSVSEIENGGLPVTAFLVSLIFTLPVLFMVSATQTVSGDEYPPVAVFVKGPENIAINATGEYTVKVDGGPASMSDSGWYTFSARIEYENKTGNPGVDPTSGNSTTGVFRINITAPATEQTITLVVTGTSETPDGQKDSAEKRVKIKIVRPVVLKAKVKNEGKIRVENVPVVFYADGKEVARTRVSLDPGEEKTVMVNWTTYDDGPHTVEVKVDPEGNFWDVTTENNVASTQIYINKPHNYLNYLYATVLVLMAFFVYGKVREARKPQPKKKW